MNFYVHNYIAVKFMKEEIVGQEMDKSSTILGNFNFKKSRIKKNIQLQRIFIAYLMNSVPNIEYSFSCFPSPLSPSLLSFFF